MGLSSAFWGYITLFMAYTIHMLILSQPFTLINHPPVNNYAHKKFSVIFFAIAILSSWVRTLFALEKRLQAKTHLNFFFANRNESRLI